MEKLTAYLQTKSPDNNGGYHSYNTQEVELFEKPMTHHLRGLSFTATGYGSRIPTRYMVKVNGKLRRVYCIQYSNAGTLFIGKKYSPCLTVNIQEA